MEKRRRPASQFDQAWNVFKYLIVGMMELVALGSMLGASMFLASPNGSVAIMLGLVVGVLGIVIYDGWKI